MSAPPYFMSRWVRPLLEVGKTVYTISVELSEEEAGKLLNANVALVGLNPTSLLSEVEYDVLYITESFIEKAIRKFGLESIVEKLRQAVKDLPLLLSYLTLRFEHCSAKDVAYHLFSEIVPDVPGVALAPTGQAFACHRSRIDVLLVLSLLSERVLMMDREYKELRYKHIHLRPLVTNFDVEWRLFYINDRLVAVSQYYLDVPQSVKRYYYATDRERVENIVRRVIESAEEARKLLSNVLQELRNYVIDVASIVAPGKIVQEDNARYIRSVAYPIIDINPLILEEKDKFGAVGTYTGLFTLDELKKLAKENRPTIPVRYVSCKGVETLEVEQNNIS